MFYLAVKDTFLSHTRKVILLENNNHKHTFNIMYNNIPNINNINYMFQV